MKGGRVDQALFKTEKIDSDGSAVTGKHKSIVMSINN
jgi:hypothetical protein